MAVLVAAGFVVAALFEGHALTNATASVEVRLSSLPAGSHRVVIAGQHGYRRAVTVSTGDGSIGDAYVPLGPITIDVDGLCTLSTKLTHTGTVASVNGTNCSI